MGKKPERKDVNLRDMLFVVGLDDKGKPRGARFQKSDDRIISAALDLLLTAVHPASAAFAEIGIKLPEGRLYASGKAFIPNIRSDLYDKLSAALAAPGDDSRVQTPTKSPEQPRAGVVQGSTVKCVSPLTSGLPRSWETIGVGHMVLMHESPDEGWWEAVVVQRDDEILTLRYRDAPKLPIFVRHINTVALLNPGPL
jgi:hypothetical protein